jgi:hypothetical protein
LASDQRSAQNNNGSGDITRQGIEMGQAGFLESTHRKFLVGEECSHRQR